MKNMNNYTSIEQSKKLLELGLNPETADMYWDYDENTQSLSEAMAVLIYEGSWKLHHKNWSKDIPCWSVGALLEVMPDIIEDKYGVTFGLSVQRKYVEYFNPSTSALALYSIYHSVSAETTLDACYDMIVWLLERKLI